MTLHNKRTLNLVTRSLDERKKAINLVMKLCIDGGNCIALQISLQPCMKIEVTKMFLAPYGKYHLISNFFWKISSNFLILIFRDENHSKF